MKKYELRSLWIAAFVSAGILLGACGNKVETSPSAVSASSAGNGATGKSSAGAITATPTSRDYVIVGVDAHSAPMAFWDTQTKVITGYDIDLAKEAFKRAGLKYEFQAIDWNKKEDNLLKDKSIDVIWSSLTINEERKKIFAFSTPYIQNKQGIMVRADSPIQNKSDLKGKTVAVQKGSNGAELVRQLRGETAPAKVDDYEQKVDQFSAVLNGKADAAVTDSMMLDYFAASSNGKFRVLKDSLQEEELGVAERPSDTELLAKINKALADMQVDGTAQAIYQRWFNSGQ